MKAVCFYLHCLLTYSINISKVYIFPEHLSMYSVYIIAVSVYLFYSIDCISVYSKHAMYTLHRYLVSMLLKFSCIIYCVQPSPTYLLYSTVCISIFWAFAHVQCTLCIDSGHNWLLWQVPVIEKGNLRGQGKCRPFCFSMFLDCSVQHHGTL